MRSQDISWPLTNDEKHLFLIDVAIPTDRLCFIHIKSNSSSIKVSDIIKSIDYIFLIWVQNGHSKICFKVLKVFLGKVWPLARGKVKVDFVNCLYVQFFWVGTYQTYSYRFNLTNPTLGRFELFHFHFEMFFTIISICLSLLYRTKKKKLCSVIQAYI